MPKIARINHVSTEGLSHQLEGIAMDHLRKLCFTSASWDLILPRHRTITFRNFLFQLSSALACGIMQKLTSVHFSFPILAFLWLWSDTSFKDQYDIIVCKQRLGHFMQSWCSYWDKRGEQGSRSARADLEALLILFQEDMGEIEALHASIRREMFVLSTRTTSLDFLELSDRHVLRCVRRHPVSYGVSKHEDVGISRHMKKLSSSGTEEPEVKKARYVRTGAYLHWFSEFAAGSEKGIVQKGIGEVYAALTPATHERHQQGAASAKRATEAGGRWYRLSKTRGCQRAVAQICC